MQEVKKNESEMLWKTLETRTKEKDMYKLELEKYKSDNSRLRNEIWDRLSEIDMLRKQVFTLEAQDDVSPDKKQEMIKAEIEHQTNLLKQQFLKS